LCLGVTFPIITDGRVGWRCFGAADEIVETAFELFIETNLDLAFSRLNIGGSFDHVLEYKDILSGDFTFRLVEITIDICDVKLIEYYFADVKHSQTNPFIVSINFHDCYSPW
jgi:hypothetical protein